MIQIITIIFGIISIVTAFFSLLWCWVIYAIPSGFLILMLFIFKQENWDYVPDLSIKANELIRKFGHFYDTPTTCRDYSAAASALIFIGIILSIISILNGFLWGIALGILTCTIMAFLSRAFNPTFFLVDDEERIAHNEIILFFERKHSKKWNN